MRQKKKEMTYPLAKIVSVLDLDVLSKLKALLAANDYLLGNQLWQYELAILIWWFDGLKSDATCSDKTHSELSCLILSSTVRLVQVLWQGVGRAPSLILQRPTFYVGDSA